MYDLGKIDRGWKFHSSFLGCIFSLESGKTSLCTGDQHCNHLSDQSVCLVASPCIEILLMDKILHHLGWLKPYK